MDDQRVGGVLRRVRLRTRRRQADIGHQVGVSQSTISRLERGHLDTLPLETIRSVGRALDVRIELVARWRGGDLDRMFSAAHSQLHEEIAKRLATIDGWQLAPEVSFSIWGERGVIDLLAWNPKHKALLVIEVKTAIVDVNELLGTLDRKVRLGREIARNRGWSVPSDVPVSAWVIVSDGRTNRRRIQAHSAMVRNALPADGRSVRAWLAKPRRPIRCLSFWPDARPRNARPGTTRG